MSVNRRDFIRYCTASAAALGLSQSELIRLGEVLAGPTNPNVLWVHGASCSGCSVSFLNRISDSDPQTAADVLIDWINLAYHPTVMAATGEMASSQIERAYHQKGYVLVVEGGVPTGFGGAACWAYTRHGHEVTFEEMLRNLASRASAVVGIGTCAGWGGIPAADPNPSTILGVGEFLGRSVVNIAGCPPHPDWIVWAIAQLVLGNAIDVDTHGRPLALFERRIHQDCPLRNEPFAETFGVPQQCLKNLGCRGTVTYGPCPTSLWNNGVNWCVNSGAGCTGCTEPDFPTQSSFYDPVSGPSLEGSFLEEPIGDDAGAPIEILPTAPRRRVRNASTRGAARKLKLRR